MNICALWVGFGLLVAALPAFGAEAGVVTIADGPARVPRGTVWYRLAAGAPFQEGHLIDAGERTQVQLEPPNGGIVNVVGPASFSSATASFPNDKPDPPPKV